MCFLPACDRGSPVPEENRPGRKRSNERIDSLSAVVYGSAVGALCAVVFLPSASQSQEPAAATKAAPVGPYRKLAPGEMITIKPDQQIGESFSRDDVHELVAIDPNLHVAKNVTFRRDIWALDFQFKPMRLIDVDIPQPSGKMQRKQIWYLVYTVTNPGKTLHPVEVKTGTPEDGNYEASYLDKPVDYVPEFILEILEAERSESPQILSGPHYSGGRRRHSTARRPQASSVQCRGNGPRDPAQ